MNESNEPSTTFSEDTIRAAVHNAFIEQSTKTLQQVETIVHYPKIKEPNGRLLVVDGHSLAFRAFFALPVDSFTNQNGQSTNAVYGFINMLMETIQKEQPTHLGVAFDMHGGTFRNVMLTGYKGTRNAAPSELLTQIPLIQQFLTALNIPYIEIPGYEGDDVIASLATYAEKNSYETLVLSGDRDSFQLIDDNITVLYPGRHFSDLQHITPNVVQEKYKVTPDQYPDIAALRGEQADNIPGVPGVGDGYAAKWLAQFGSLENLLNNAQNIPGKKGQALRDNIEQVKLNRRVNAVVRNLDCGVDFQQLHIGQPHITDVARLLSQLQFGKRMRDKVATIFNIDSNSLIPQQSPSNIHKTEQQEFSYPLDNYQPADPQTDQIHDDTHTITDNQHLSQWFTDTTNPYIIYCNGTYHPGQSHCTTISFLRTDHHLISLQHTDCITYHDTIQHILHTRPLIVHGYKQTIQLAAEFHLTIPQPLFDTELAAYLIDSEYTGETLTDLASHFLQYKPALAHQTTAYAIQDGFDFGSDEELIADQHNEQEKNILACSIINALYISLASVIHDRNQDDLLTRIEIPTAAVLADIEMHGSAVDSSRLDQLLQDFSLQAQQAHDIALEAAGPGHDDLNLQSPKQLSHVLFDEMNLKGGKKTKTGGYSTNASALQKLYLCSYNNDQANTFLGALLRYREVNKLKQIMQSLKDAIHTDDHCIHTTFCQNITATGRLSSMDPNLQNIPNRSTEGRLIRSIFVPQSPYISLLSADYSQMELRIMAHLSGDKALIEAFTSGVDFHRYTASLVYQTPMEQVTDTQRNHVKAMSYGLAYGLSTYGLSQQLSISNDDAEELKSKYFKTFGSVEDYLKSLVDKAKKLGYTETMFGRRRYFPNLRSNNRTARMAAERAALNAPIQGSSADIMKIAMVRTAHDLNEAHLQSTIILQIHDELVIEVASHEEEQVTSIVKNAMEHAITLSVPLTVSIGMGTNWQTAAH